MLTNVTKGVNREILSNKNCLYIQVQLDMRE